MADNPENGAGAAGDGQSPESLSESLGRLQHATAALIRAELRVAAADHAPELRRAGRDLAATVALAVAAVTALALVNWAVVDALSGSLSSWRAPLLMAVVWAVVAGVLAVAVAARAGEATGLWSWRRLTAREQADAGGERAEALEDAQQDVQEALERVAAAAALELAERMAAAAVPTAGEVIEVGEDIVEASEDVLDDVEAHVPAGSVVGQVIDLALVPGRFGLRIATTVLRGDSRAG